VQSEHGGAAGRNSNFEFQETRENDMKTIASMTLITLAVAMVMLAAPAVHAQEQYFNAEYHNGHYSAVEPPVSPADTHYAYFNAEIGNPAEPSTLSALAAAAPDHSKEIGSLKLAAATMFGDVVLQPGKYEVSDVNVGEKHFVEFSQIVEDDYVPEGQSVYVRQVVARVGSTPETLDAIAALTHPHRIIAGTAARTVTGGGK
jgi:hypothetical protein